MLPEEPEKLKASRERCFLLLPTKIPQTNEPTMTGKSRDRETRLNSAPIHSCLKEASVIAGLATEPERGPVAAGKSP